MKNSTFDNLVMAANNELYQFAYNKPIYTVADLISYGLEARIPNLIKLLKQVENIKIRNIGNFPVLQITFNDEKKEKSTIKKRRTYKRRTATAWYIIF